MDQTGLTSVESKTKSSPICDQYIQLPNHFHIQDLGIHQSRSLSRSVQVIFLLRVYELFSDFMYGQ